MNCVCGSTTHSTKINKECPFHYKNSPVSLILTQINLLDLLKSSPNKIKKTDSNSGSNTLKLKIGAVVMLLRN